MDITPVASDTVLLRIEGGVAWITLNRPERLNAFAGAMRDELHDALTTASEAAGTRVIVVTGAGRGFCTGADVEVMSDLLAQSDVATFERYVQAGMRVVRRIRSIPQPVIAAVNGAAAGAGAALTLSCDLRVASERATIGFTFNRIGLHPDWGTTYFLPRLVGAGRAAELVLSARMLDAAEAERIGLFSRVFPAEAFEAEVRKLAEEYAAKPPLALALAKRSLDRTFESDLDAMLTVEEEAQLRCFQTADALEGIAAFNEKRRPAFTGA